MARLEALYVEWGDEPPADVFVAAYFGYKKPRRSDEDVNGWMMLAEFPSGVIGINQ